jgi:hypothetical protein
LSSSTTARADSRMWMRNFRWFFVLLWIDDGPPCAAMLFVVGSGVIDSKEIIEGELVMFCLLLDTMISLLRMTTRTLMRSDYCSG